MRNAGTMRGRNRRRGQALVPVLFIVVILTAFAVTVSGTARREVRAAGNYLKEAQAHFIARGAVEYALAELQQSTGGGITPPQLAAPPDTDANGWTQLGDGWYKVEVIDTASRVNINTASFAMLVKLPAFQANRELAVGLEGGELHEHGERGRVDVYTGGGVYHLHLVPAVPQLGPPVGVGVRGGGELGRRDASARGLLQLGQGVLHGAAGDEVGLGLLQVVARCAHLAPGGARDGDGKGGEDDDDEQHGHEGLPAPPIPPAHCACVSHC